MITDRWRYTSAALDVGALANLGQKAFSHDGYLGPAESKPPAVRFGVFVACGLLADDEPTAERLRSSMRDCLSQPEVMSLIGKLTNVDAGAEWHSQPGRGRFNLEADLLGPPGTGKVFASALLLLPERGTIPYGKDHAGAELYLHVDLPVKDGEPARAGLAEWHGRLISALGLPGFLSRFLESAGLLTSGDPAPRFAMQFQAGSLAAIGLDEMVDFGDLAVLSPRKYSVQFDGWAVANEQGKAAAAVSRRFLTELCESTGRTGYESVLADLADAEDQSGDFQPSGSRKGSRAVRVGALCVIAVVAIGAAAIGFWISAPSRTAVAKGTITAPPNGATNVYKHEQLRVSGTAQNIPSGDRLDVFLQFVGSQRYYSAANPEIAAPLIRGHWSATIFIGDAGPIILWLVSLSPAQVNLMNSPGEVAYQSAGYPTLPGTRLASVGFTANAQAAALPPATPERSLNDPGSTGVYGVAYSPNGKVLAAGDLNGATYLWDAATGAEPVPLRNPNGQGVYGVAFSPDGTLVAAGNVNSSYKKGSITLWSVKTGKLIATLIDPGGTGVAGGVAFNPDGTILAAADGNGGIYLWNVATHQPALPHPLRDPGGTGVYGIAFSPRRHARRSRPERQRVPVEHEDRKARCRSLRRPGQQGYPGRRRVRRGRQPARRRRPQRPRLHMGRRHRQTRPDPHRQGRAGDLRRRLQPDRERGSGHEQQQPAHQPHYLRLGSHHPSPCHLPGSPQRRRHPPGLQS